MKQVHACFLFLLVVLALSGCADNSMSYGGATSNFGSSGSAALEFPKKFPYSSPTLQYVSTSAPFPAAHLRCMKIADDMLVTDVTLLPKIRIHNQNYENFLALTHGFANLDWGISSQVNYRTLEKKAVPLLEKAKARLAQARADVRELRAKKRQMAAAGIPSTEFQMIDVALQASEDNVIYQEMGVANSEGWERYDTCVVQNNLPPTENSD